MSDHDKLREAIKMAKPEIERAMECFDPVMWTGRDGPAIHAGYLKTIIAAAEATLPPPPPRKVEVKGWAVMAQGMPGVPELYIAYIGRTKDDAVKWGCTGQPIVELTGTYEVQS